MTFWSRVFLLVMAVLAVGGTARAADPQNILYMDLAVGRVVIELRPDLAPNTCTQVKKLTRAGFYDGVVFHRVIAGFMAQGGDPTGTGTGGSGHPLKAEFSSEPFVRGVVAMAHAADPNSADSQFFIMYAEAPALDGKYTIFGKVVSGMEFVDKIKKGGSLGHGTTDVVINTGHGMVFYGTTGAPAERAYDHPVVDPDRIVKMQVAADVR